MDRLVLKLFDRLCQANIILAMQEQERGDSLLPFNPLRSNVAYLQRETFSFMMSHPAMSLRDRLCASRKGGAGGGGWVHPKGANSMAAFGLSFERPSVGAG